MKLFEPRKMNQPRQQVKEANKQNEIGAEVCKRLFILAILIDVDGKSMFIYQCLC